MPISQQSLREQLRQASEAWARARERGQRKAVANRYVSGGFTETHLEQLKQALLEDTHKRLTTARAAALGAYEAAGLPGLPSGGQIDDADGSLSEAEAALTAAWRNLAQLETLQGDANAAIAAYRKALDIAPDDMISHAELAELLESHHDLTNAQAHAERALRADRTNLSAGLALARVLLRQDKFADAERAALSVAESPRAGADDCGLAWALVGEARDRLDNTTAAFKAFTRGNQAMLSRYGYMQNSTHPAHPANVRILTRFVERLPAPRTRAAYATPSPAFLIGFPRSGTTLLEQILASHSGITCLGETDYLFEALSVVLRDGDLLDRVTALTASEIETVRATHRAMVLRDHPQADGHIVVDKHPLHIVLLPLINKVFPDAKIILGLRDPRDVVLSCYQQCFTINVATAQFLELERAAGYFDAVMELLLACRSKLDLDLLESDYRGVVADLEGAARRMATFLGVRFEPAMLRFDEQARSRAVTSASLRQVINPIYDRSVGRWRRYARELAPVLPLLDKWARRLGYEE